MKKNKKIILPLFIMLLGAMCTFYACKKENKIKENKVEEAHAMSANIDLNLPTVTNGWLKFDSLGQFKDVVDFIHNNYSDVELTSFDELLPNFTSLRKQYEIIDADSSDERTSLTVDSLIETNQILDCPDDWFASLLSKDGYLQIGDTILAYKPGNENGDAYAVPAKYADVIKETPDLNTLPGTRVFQTSFLRFPFPRHLDDSVIIWQPPYPSFICLNVNNPLHNWWGQKGDNLYQGNNGVSFPKRNGRTVKLYYCRWRTSYGVYSSVGCRLEMLRHTRFAGWLSNTYADKMTMEACCEGTENWSGAQSGSNPFSAHTTPDWPNFYHTSENKFSKTMDYCVGYLYEYPDIVLTHFNFHFKVDYRGVIAEKYIRE